MDSRVPAKRGPLGKVRDWLIRRQPAKTPVTPPAFASRPGKTLGATRWWQPTIGCFGKPRVLDDERRAFLAKPSKLEPVDSAYFDDMQEILVPGAKRLREAIDNGDVEEIGQIWRDTPEALVQRHEKTYPLVEALRQERFQVADFLLNKAMLLTHTPAWRADILRGTSEAARQRRDDAWVAACLQVITNCQTTSWLKRLTSDPAKTLPLSVAELRRMHLELGVGEAGPSVNKFIQDWAQDLELWVAHAPKTVSPNSANWSLMGRDGKLREALSAETKTLA